MSKCQCLITERLFQWRQHQQLFENFGLTRLSYLTCEEHLVNYTVHLDNKRQPAVCSELTITVDHKLRPTGQILPATSHQVARKVQQESLIYEKYGTSFIA